MSLETTELDFKTHYLAFQQMFLVSSFEYDQSVSFCVGDCVQAYLSHSRRFRNYKAAKIPQAS